MDINKSDFSFFDNDFGDSPYLDYEEDNVFLEWYSIEGEEQIKELSRQLRTFLNYKKSLILLRYSNSINLSCSQNLELVNERDRELNNLAFQLTAILKTIGVETGGISEQVFELVNRIKSNPNKYEIEQIKKLNLLTTEIWKLLHILSELEIHHKPSLFKRILCIANICCEIKSILSPLFYKYYQELRINYLHLENEISSLLPIITNDSSLFEKRKFEVKLLE